MKISNVDLSKKKCPICGAELTPVQQTGKPVQQIGKIVYFCNCVGFLRAVIEVLPEQKGVENDCAD